jgi:hypothetical protein
MKKSVLGLLLIATTLALLTPYLFVSPVSAAGATYYVSTSGSNSNPGTLAQPWKTIQKAANTVTQGDTVYIRGGTYNEKVSFSNVQGTSTAWINFAPYNSESVTVSGSGIGTGYDGIIEFNDGCRYIRITGLEIKNTNGHGVFLLGGEITNIRIDHCIIHNCQSSGIYAYSASQPTKYVRNIEFDYNTVYDVNNGYSYDDSHSLSPQEAISFSNVQGFNIHHNNLYQYGKEGIDTKSGSSSGSIHHNTICNSRASPAFSWSFNHIGIYIDGFSYKNHDIDVYCNVITGYGGPGIVIGAESGGSIEDISIYNNVISLTHLSGHTNFRAIDSCYDVQFKNVYIYSNSIYNGGSSNSPLRIFPSAGNIVNVVIANNIISGSAYHLICFQELRSTEVSGRLTLKNNLYYCYGDSGHNLWKNGEDKSWGTSYVLTDPKYVSKSDNNLHILSSSPAINAGTSTMAPTTDIEGVSRPQGGSIDIGAYETVSTTNNPLVFSGMSPADGSTNVPILVSSLSVTIQDPEGQAFSYTIQTRPNVGSKSASAVYDGVKTCTLSGLSYGTTYRWWVNATDGSSWTRRLYTFTTASNPGNSPPAFSSISPANGSTNVPIGTTELSLYISDPEGKTLSYSIQTRPNVGSISVNNVYGGTKYCTLSGLAYSTTYRWWVNATDGSSWTRRWYTFTTVSNSGNSPPAFSSMFPANGSINVPINTGALTLTIRDPEGKSFSFTIQTRPNVGSISVNNVYGSTKYCTLSGLTYSTTYRWWVNASDGSSWTRRWFTFTTEPKDSQVINPGGSGTDNQPAGNDEPLNPLLNNPPNPPSTPAGQFSVVCGKNYSYTCSAIDPDGDQIRVQINWDDGNVSDWSEFNVSNATLSFTHAWKTPSNYSLSAIAQDNYGNLSNWSPPLLITVVEQGNSTDTPTEPENSTDPAVIDIRTINNASGPLTIIFDASNTTVPEGSITSYQWNFGDGSTGSGITSHHSYTKPGVYEVNLTVTDDNEQTFSKTIEIIVDVGTGFPEIPKTSSFSYITFVLLIVECVIVVGMMLISKQKRMLKKYQSKKSSRDLSVEEKVDFLLSQRFNR